MKKKLCALLTVLALAIAACAMSVTAFAGPVDRDDERPLFPAYQAISADKQVESETEEGKFETVRDDSAAYVRFGRFNVDLLTSGGWANYISDFARLKDVHEHRVFSDRVEIMLPGMSDYMRLTEFNTETQYVVVADQLHGDKANVDGIPENLQIPQKVIDRTTDSLGGGWNFVKLQLTEGEIPVDFPQGTKILLQKNMPTLAERTYLTLFAPKIRQTVRLDKTYYLELTENGWSFGESDFDRTEVSSVSQPITGGEGSSAYLEFDITFNNAVTAGETATAQELESFYNSINVNYATCAEHNGENQGSVTISGGGTTLKVKVLKSVLYDPAVAYSNYITVDRSMSVYNSIMAVEYATYYNSAVNAFIDEPIENSYEKAKVTKATDVSTVTTAERTSFLLAFDRAPSDKNFTFFNAPIEYQKANKNELALNDNDLYKIELQPSRESVLSAVKIGGKTVAQIMEEFGDDAVQIGFDMTAYAMTVSLRSDVANFADTENYVTFEVDSTVFCTPNGQMLTADVSKYYLGQYDVWYNIGEPDDMPAAQVSQLVKATTAFAGYTFIRLAFDKNFTEPPAALGDFIYWPSGAFPGTSELLSFLNHVFINGKSVTEIMADPVLGEMGQFKSILVANDPPLPGKPQAGILFWVVDEYINNIPEGQEAATFEIRKTITVNAESKECTLPSGYTIDKDYSYTYNGTEFTLAGQIPVSEQVKWEEVKLLNVSAPAQDTYGVKFTLTFDRDVSKLFYASFTANDDYLLLMGQHTPAAYPYTQATIDSFKMVGLKDSIMDNVVFGMNRPKAGGEEGETEFVRETVRQMLERETDLFARNNTLMFHVAAWGAANQVEFYLLDESTQSNAQNQTGANKITDLNQPFEFTLKKGARFPAAVEIKQDVTFRMNTSTGEFENTDESAQPSSDTSVEYLLYNGKQIKAGDTITITEGDVFNASLFSVKTASSGASYEITGFESITVGESNTVAVTVFAEDETIGEPIVINVTVLPKDVAPVEEEEKGCGSAAASALGVTLVCAAMLSAAFVLLRRKRA